MKLLVDGDIPVYRMGWAVQKTHYQHKVTGEFFDGIKKAKEYLKEMHAGIEWDLVDWEVNEEIEPWSNCKFLIDSFMSTLMRNTAADSYEVYLSPSETFRHRLATVRPYKGTRRPPPRYKDKNREYLIQRYGAEVAVDIEADDMLGMNQTEDTCIASIDKDLLQIPGHHYDVVKETSVCVDLLEADNMFFAQLLAGDSTDNIVGIPGIGMKKAMGIVDMFEGDHYGLVEEINTLYEENYPNIGMEIRDEMAQLVYILRKGDTLGQEQWRNLLNPTSLDTSTCKPQG